MVAAKVILAVVVPLLFGVALNPVGSPPIVPIVAATWVAPLYAITFVTILEAIAAEVSPANVWF